MKFKSPAHQANPHIAARTAGLHYVVDNRPGITRLRRADGFDYFRPNGRPLRDRNALVRLKRLAIPPAWERVWICPTENGHIQATGYDVRGRKQYRYHADWRKVRDENKYGHLLAFGRALPKIRRRVARDLRKRGLPRDKVLATVVRLLEATLIRVGNEEYVRANKSYGLATMRDRHVRIRGGKVTFSFKGKSGRHHVIDVENAALAKIVKRCRDLPGQELFQYLDDFGAPVNVTSSDVNDYLHAIAGDEFTAKDFRTWAGTVLAARALREFEKFESQREAKRNMLAAVEAVSRMLGNTPDICRRCYVHPLIFEVYLDGALADRLEKLAEHKLIHEMRHLRPDEATVLALLRSALAQGRSGKG